MSVYQQLQQQQAAANAMFQAEQEMDAMTDVFNRIVDACHRKCIPPKYGDSELNKGESVCIDRCVVKYLEVHQKVGQKFQGQMEAANAAAAAAGGEGVAPSS